MARTLAWSLKRPLIGINPVELVALTAHQQGRLEVGRDFAAATHGFRTTIFSGRFRLNSDGIVQVTDTLQYDDDLEAFTERQNPDRPCYTLAEFPFDGPSITRLGEGDKTTEVLLREAHARLEREAPPSLESVQPLYIKPFSVGPPKAAPGGRP